MPIDREISLAEWTQIAFVFGAGAMIMLIGTAVGDDRLVVSGIPLPPLLFACAALAVFALKIPGEVHRVVWISHSLVALLAVTVLWSYQPDYGAWKLANLLASSMLSVFLFWYVIDRGGWRRFYILWVLLLVTLLSGALIYKIFCRFLEPGYPFLA